MKMLFLLILVLLAAANTSAQTKSPIKISGTAGVSYDTYGMLYEGQYLQLLKGLETGEYVLEIEIDPHHGIKKIIRLTTLSR